MTTHPTTARPPVTRPLPVLAALALVLAACAGGDDGGSASGGDAPPTDTATDAATDEPTGDGAADGSTEPGPFGPWTLAAVEPAIDVPDDAEVTLELRREGDQVRLGGTAACNTYGGRVELDDGWSAGPIFQTEMACMDPLMEVEAAYLAALGQVTDWEVTDDGRLVLSGSATTLTFAPGPAAPTDEESP